MSVTLIRPPRYPRAMFIAAFAVAGALAIRLRAGTYAPDTPALIDRRDLAIRGIVARFGRAMLAAKRAQERFNAECGLIERPVAAAPRLDPVLAAVVNSPAVASAIGKPSHERCDEAAWVEVRHGVRPYLNIFWRGELMRAEAPVTAVGAGGRVTRATGKGDGVRRLDKSRMEEAVDAAKKALRAAGFPPSAFVELRRAKVDDLGGAGSFEGWIATIGLVPIKTPQRAVVR